MDSRRAVGCNPRRANEGKVQTGSPFEDVVRSGSPRVKVWTTSDSRWFTWFLGRCRSVDPARARVQTNAPPFPLFRKDEC